MDPTERALLDAVARDRDDLAALSVLADYWIAHGDAERGTFVQLHCGDADARLDLDTEERRLAALAAAWRAPLVAAGFDADDLVLDRGLLQWPLALPAGDPLDDAPALLRASPRFYRIHRELAPRSQYRVVAADEVTPLSARPTERVAIKYAIERGDLASQEWLDREHAILRRIAHPNVAASLGFAVLRDGRGLVTRWAGVEVAALLRETRRHGLALGPGVAVSIAVQLCAALDACHRAGVVHGEVRPDHVLLAEDGTVTLIDFGCVHTAIPTPAPRYYSPAPRRRGAFRYMSPEQVMGRQLDGRTDVMSTAVVACELVDGECPIGPRANDMDALIAVRDLQHRLPRVPLPIAEVLARAIAPRARRIASAAELGAELTAAAAHANIPIGRSLIAQTLIELGVAA